MKQGYDPRLFELCQRVADTDKNDMAELQRRVTELNNYLAEESAQSKKRNGTVGWGER